MTSSVCVTKGIDAVAQGYVTLVDVSGDLPRRDLLMFAPSKRRAPLFLVAEARSLPAKSMIERVE